MNKPLNKKEAIINVLDIGRQLSQLVSEIKDHELLAEGWRQKAKKLKSDWEEVSRDYKNLTS